MKKILIRGTQAYESIGVRAMTICTMNIIQKHIPDAKFVFFSYNKLVDEELYKNKGFDIEIIEYVGSPLLMLNRLMKAKLFKNKKNFNDPILNAMKSSDLIIDMFGDGFGDNTGGKVSSMPSIGHSLQILMSKFLNKPDILFPQSIGPFNNYLVRKLAKYSMNKSERVVAREKYTQNYLEKIGVNKNLINLTADTAFVLEPSPKEEIDSMFTELICDNKKPLVGLNISQLLNYRSKNTEINYIEIMVNLVNYISNKYDVNILLLPHAIFPKNTGSTAEKEIEEDTIAVKEVYKLVESKNVFKIDDINLSESDLKGIINQCEAFLGARMHANIAAVSSCVPTLAIAYSPKAPGIMEMVGLEDYLCEFNELNLKDMTIKFDSLWENREQIKTKMIPRINELKEAVWENGKIAAKLLNKKDI